MNEIKTTNAFIDWLTVISPKTTQNRWIRHFLDQQDTLPTKSAYHHSHAVEYYPAGWRQYFTPQAEDKPSVLVIDGQAGAYLRETMGEENTRKVVAILARSADHFSRIDFAVDIMDNGQTAHEVYQLAEAGEIDFGRRKVFFRKDAPPDNGLTTYVGRRTSPKQLRFYDKFAESKGLIPSSRIEFEIKADAAHAVSQAMNSYNSHHLIAPLFTGLLLDFADWSPVPLVESLAYGEVQTVAAPPRERLLDSKAWLTRQVLPTFLKGAKGRELWTWFQDLVNDNLGTPKE